MTEGMSKPTAKRATRTSGASKPAAKAQKSATANTKAKAPSKAVAKAKPSTRSIEKATGKSASQLTVKRMSGLGDWRVETLASMRTLILEADPEIVEEQKWKKPSNGMVGVPVWSHNGILCTGETYKQVVKLTFARGASLPDPSKLFNSSLEGNTRRAIDIHDGERVDADAFKSLVKAAVAENAASKKR